MSIGYNLKAKRLEKGYTLEDLAKQVGTSKQTIQRYETGIISNIPSDKIELLAKALDTTPAYLMGWEDSQQKKLEIPGVMPVGNLVALKLIASVRAGYGGTAVADWDGEYENIPEFMLKGYPQDECVLFKVKGDSMYPRLLDGDLIVVHVQSSVDSGDTAIIVYNGDEGTVKKVNYVYGEDWLELIPTNPEYPNKRIEGADLEQCHVYGKVLGLFGNI